MDIQIQKKDSFEEEIRNVMRGTENGELFLKDLRGRLLTYPARDRMPRVRFHARLVSVSAVILIVFIAVILWMGPGRVYAGLQNLIGYIPGVGFVNTDNGWGLKETVSQSRGQEQFEVQQLFTSNEETFLVIHLTGFSAYQEIGLDQGIALRLANGAELHPNGKMVEVTSLPGEYWGIFQFHSLPNAASSLSVVWDPSGMKSDTQTPAWEVPVRLYPLSEAEMAALLPKAYSPQGASAMQNDITLIVEQVSQSLKDTALKIRMNFPSAFFPIYFNDFVLQDDQGRIYQQIERGIHFEDQGQRILEIDPTGAASETYQSYSSTYDFMPVDVSARTLTFQVNALTLRAELKQVFKIDLGEMPQIGDHWEINQRITAGDLAFEVQQARLVPLKWEGQNLAGLVLDLKILDPENVQINQLWLNTLDEETGVYQEETRTWLSGWPADALPNGKIDLTLSSIELVLKSNWEMTWVVGE